MLDAGLRQPEQGRDLPQAAPDDRLTATPALLWRDRSFLLLWSGQGISVVGSAVSEFALPTLAVLVLHAGAAQVGLLFALQRLPFPFLSLFAGAMVDRLPKRPVMIVCDLLRTLLMASIPLAAVAGALQLPQLYVLALLSGICTVFFDIAYLAYVPALVGRPRLLRANTLMEVTYSTAGLVGPGIAGVLVQVVGAARTMALDAASFLVSVVALFLIRAPEPEPPPRPEGSNAVREIADGVAVVVRQPVLLSMLVTMGVLIVAAHAVQPVAVVFAYRTLHFSPAALGIAFSVEGVGSVLGAATSTAVVARLGVGRVMVLTSVGSGLGLAAIPLALYAQPMVVFSAALFVLGLTGALQNVVQLSLRQALTPDTHQARMTATFRTVYWGAWPLGNFIGGAAGAAFGAAPVIVVAAVVVVLAGAAMGFTPLARVKDAAA